MKILLITVFVLLTYSGKSNSQESIIFIINKNNPTERLTRSEINDYFFKNVKQWPNGSAVRFIDRQTNSEERRKFLKLIIKKSNSEVDIFWIGQKLYTGSSAPLQVNSDQMMTSVVASFSGAIGYVSDNFIISDRVKKVEVSN